MKMRFFDFEVFPHWWCCTFGDLNDGVHECDESIKETFNTVTSDDPRARDTLMQWFSDDYCMTGYNIKGYDLIIANGIYQGFDPERLKILNDIIINPGLAYSTKEHIRMQPFAKKRLSGICYQDLMDDSTGSLKEKEAVLGLSILESNVSFDKEDLTEQDKKDVIYYNKQDVYATMRFYCIVSYPYVENKLHVGKRFNIPEKICYTSTNAKLISIALGAHRMEHLDAERPDIVLPDKIYNYCYENLPIKIIERIINDANGFKTELFHNEVSFGNGGIHSVYTDTVIKTPCLYVETNDEWILVCIDARSYYPSEMLEFNLLSRNVVEPKLFREIFDERMSLKHKKDKTIEEENIVRADKLVMNTTFGASGNQYLELFDPYMCTSVCRVGQIFLGALASEIDRTIDSAKIIQTNTDGIYCYLRRNDLYKLDALQAKWTAMSGINMDRDIALKLWQRDVNNYLMIVEEDGEQHAKIKGGWLNTTYMRPGTNKVASAAAFVCSKAIIDYLTKDKDIIQSIVANKNLADFTMTCTKGPTYRGVLQRNANGDIQLFKANRVVASKDTNKGKLYKYKMFKGNLQYTQMPSTPEHCLLVNDDLSHYNFKDIAKELDYMYYVQRCADMLDMDWYELCDGELFKTSRFNYFN